jgi:hypothetical protein
MPKAYVHLRDGPHYRKQAFITGFARLGFSVVQGQPEHPMQPGDVGLIWNKTARSQQTVKMAQIGGCPVMVAENGYVGKDAQGIQPYALALDGHNGSGRWHAPNSSRMEALHLDLKPLKDPLPFQSNILVADQRGIGSDLMRSPPRFGASAVATLQSRGFSAHLRPHPGRNTPATTLVDDLANCAALVVWSSNCATTAIIAGLPVYYAAPTMACTPAVVPFNHGLGIGALPSEADRLQGLTKMAWAQWFISEITSGEPLKLLLDVHSGKLDSCQSGFGL